jgi:hypothetical protein
MGWRDITKLIIPQIFILSGYTLLFGVDETSCFLRISDFLIAEWMMWLVMHLPRESENPHERPQSGQPVSRPRFEPAARKHNYRALQLNKPTRHQGGDLTFSESVCRSVSLLISYQFHFRRPWKMSLLSTFSRNSFLPGVTAICVRGLTII